jgi:hypothetical protein
LPVGAEVIVTGLKGEPANDRYGRTLVDGSLWLVAQRWAQVYEAYPTSEGDDARDLAACRAVGGTGNMGNLHGSGGDPMTRAAPYALLAVVAAASR